MGPYPETADGNKYILVLTDYLTRWVEAFAVPDASADTAAKYLFEIVSRHSFPERLL